MGEIEIIVNQIYCDRQKHNGVLNCGYFDAGGRWYPNEREICECCSRVRSPSRAYPYSLLRHIKTKRHIRELVLRRLHDVQ